MGEKFERETYACLAFAGAVLILVGALAALTSPKTKVLWVILAIGGILAIIGSAWALSDIETGGILGVSVDRGYGIYLTLVGGILGLIGILGLSNKTGGSNS